MYNFFLKEAFRDRIPQSEGLFPTLEVKGIVFVETMQWHYIKVISEMQIGGVFHSLV